MTLNPRVYNHFKEYATGNVHPMTALRTSVSYIAHFDEHAEDEDESQTLIVLYVFKPNCFISYGLCTC